MGCLLHAGATRFARIGAPPWLRAVMEWANLAILDMEQPSFGDVVDLVLKEDPRYDKRAYFFLREALDYTVNAVRKDERKSGKQRGTSHVSGPELLEGIRTFALRQYGPMAHYLFSEWGLTTCSDFGEMVFRLIEFGVFSKTDSDRKEDFGNIYDFGDAFVKPFEPKKKRPAGETIERLEGR